MIFSFKTEKGRQTV